jgi:hypothetical protein
VTSGPMLGNVWVQLIEDTLTREKMSAAARAITERNRGATARSLDRIAAMLPGESVNPRARGAAE